MDNEYYVYLTNDKGCQFDFGAFDTIEAAKEFASGRGGEYRVRINNNGDGYDHVTYYTGWLTPQGFKDWGGWNWQVMESQWRSDREYHAKSVSEKARYLVVYSKPHSSFEKQTWKDTLQEADVLADRLELIGYSVDIWKHTAAGARPVYSIENFETHLGWNYDPRNLSSLSDKELAAIIYASDEWYKYRPSYLHWQALRELCSRADLDGEFDALDNLDNADDLFEKAINILEISIPNVEAFIAVSREAKRVEEKEIYIGSLSNKDLIAEIMAADEWNADLMYELCWRADLLHGDKLGNVDALIEKAADILGVYIPDKEPSHRDDDRPSVLEPLYEKKAAATKAAPKDPTKARSGKDDPDGR